MVTIIVIIILLHSQLMLTLLKNPVDQKQLGQKL